jgi:hypothetical protein
VTKVIKCCEYTIVRELQHTHAAGNHKTNASHETTQSRDAFHQVSSKSTAQHTTVGTDVRHGAEHDCSLPSRWCGLGRWHTGAVRSAIASNHSHREGSTVFTLQVRVRSAKKAALISKNLFFSRHFPRKKVSSHAGNAQKLGSQSPHDGAVDTAEHNKTWL